MEKNKKSDIICLGEKMFKEYREKRNFTQEELAELIDVSTRTIQRIENKETNPKIKTLRKLIHILKIKDEDIIKIIKYELLEK